MNIVPASSNVRSSRRVSADLYVHAAEPTPAYPALVARAAGIDAEEELYLRVHAVDSRRALIDALERGTPTLALLAASDAVRALAKGLPARIVASAVSAGDLSAADDLRDDSPTPLRAMLLAPLRSLSLSPTSVRAAVRAYWRGASLAVSQPALLGAVLAAEFGFTAPTAHREALRAIDLFKSDPTVDLQPIEKLLSQLRRQNETRSGLRAGDLLDAR